MKPIPKSVMFPFWVRAAKLTAVPAGEKVRTTRIVESVATSKSETMSRWSFSTITLKSNEVQCIPGADPGGLLGVRTLPPPLFWGGNPILHKGPLHKGLRLLIPHFNSSYPCTKPISIAHQMFLIPPCHKKFPCFVRGVAHSASSRLKDRLL